MTLGVLEAATQWAKPDRAAGIKVAVLKLDLAQWEPQRAADERTYVDAIKQAAQTYVNGAWRLAVDLGLKQPPPWVLASPGEQLVNQWGQVSHSANFEFSRDVRNEAQHYFGEVARPSEVSISIGWVCHRRGR